MSLSYLNELLFCCFRCHATKSIFTEPLGSITSRYSGNEPALPGLERAAEVEPTKPRAKRILWNNTIDFVSGIIQKYSLQLRE